MNSNSIVLKGFHDYIDIHINNNKFTNEDLYKIQKLKSIYCKEIPKADIHRYINYLLKSIITKLIDIDGLLIHTIIILNRVLHQNIQLNHYNAHRLIFICLMISSKIYDEFHYCNGYWSVISGTTLEDVNQMEIELLQYIDYDVFIAHEHMSPVVKSIKI